MMEIDPSDAMLLFFGVFSVMCISVAIMANNKQEHELARERVSNDIDSLVEKKKFENRVLNAQITGLEKMNKEYLSIIKGNIKVQEETIKHLAKALKKDVVKVDNENVTVSGDGNKMSGRDYTA